MKARFQPIILCILFFICPSITWGKKNDTFGPRRLIILFDPHGQELSSSESSAITQSLIAGLNQKSAPILVSESLWNSFIIRRFRYQRLKDNQSTGQKILSNLIDKHAKIIIGPRYTPTNIKDIKAFQEKIRKLYAAHFGYYQKALQVFRNQPPSKGFFQKTPIDKLKKIEVTEQELQLDHPLRKDINFDFIAHQTDFNPSEWTIKHIPHFAYVLIPQTYQEQITKNVDQQKLPKIPGISSQELILGLKIDHLPSVTDPLNVPEKEMSAQQIETTDDFDLTNLFVTRKDLGLLDPLTTTKAPESYENYLGTWNVYATGHGSPDKTPILQEQINIKEQQLEKTKKDLKTYKEQLEEYKKEQQEIKKKWMDAPSGSALEEMYATQKSSIYDTITSFETVVNTHKELMQALQEQIAVLKIKLASGDTGASIGGLHIDEFKKLLSFFNTSVRTGLFFYDTCFGSGKNLEAPYQYEDVPQIYNYTIVSGATLDAPTSISRARIAVPPYTKGGWELADATETRNNQIELKIQLEQNFTNYFTQLEAFQTGATKPPLADILNTIHRFKSPWDAITKLYNVPLIRYPNTEWFRIVDMPKVVQSITEQSVITHQAENKPFTITRQNVLLLYTTHIPLPVIMAQDKMPAVLSMIGGDAEHYFEEISAPQVPLSEIIQKCMPIPKQFFTKKFFIKKLTCFIDKEHTYGGLLKPVKGMVTTLHNVVIINNEKKLFANNEKQPVNVLLFHYKLKGENKVHKATWPITQEVVKGTVPNLDFYPSNHPEYQQLTTFIEQSFSTASKPPSDRTEQLAGRRTIRAFLQETATPLLQKYKELHETNPQGIAPWLKTLKPDERAILTRIHLSETKGAQPTLTKSEFDTLHKTIEIENQPPTVIKKTTKPIPKQTNTLIPALEQLQTSLRKLEQRLR